MEAKLEFASLVAPDVVDRFTSLIADPAAFFERSKVFELFSYQRCFESTPENVAATRRWVRMTTALTRYEAPVCLALYDVSAHRKLLDVGGNSGEFALQACRANAALFATVHDLPVVCDLGEEHVAGKPEAARISFSRARSSADALPSGFDLVTFKSMLHDWPSPQMRHFLHAAHGSLAPGGTVVIFERARFDATKGVPYSLVPLLLFFRSYRGADDYRKALGEAGFGDIRAETVELDMPFHLITARR
jgi:hypothetical protein